MHKLILAALLPLACCLSSVGRAQGNLQFNQVIFYDLLFGTPQAFTVPAGKVWKIESVGLSSAGCNVYLLNSSSQYVGILFSGGTTNVPNLPAWLPSSWSGFFSYNIGSCSGQRAFVSIIEFNVVP